MKKLICFLSLVTGVAELKAQAVVTATNVRLNSSAGTRLVIQGGISFTGTSNFIDNGRVDILTNPLGPTSNWNDGTASGAYDATSTGHVFFSASGLQTITGPSRFYDLTMNGTTGISLGSDIEVRDNLFLNGGMFTTGTNKVYVSNPALNAIQSSNSFSSFINGILERSANIATAPAPYSNGYLFPVGKVIGPNAFYAPVYFNKINANATRYTAEYFRGIPFDRLNILSPPIHNISTLEYWEITSTTAAGSTDDDAALSLSWRTESIVSTNPLFRDSLMVAHYRNNGGFRWEPEAAAPSTPVNVIGSPSFGFVTTNTGAGVGSFTFADRRFTLATRIPNNVLPLRKFDWTLLPTNSNAAFIKWNIEDDMQIKQYVLEKSSDDAFYSTLNITPAKQVASSMGYSFIDEHPVNGWNYYRIKIVSLNGQATFSSVKKLQFVRTEKLKLYPNPAISVVNVQLFDVPEPGAILQIRDMSGRLVYETNTLQINNQIQVSKLPAGTYQLLYRNRNVVQAYKFIKIGE